MKKFSAVALACMLCASVLLTFLPDVWATSLIEVAVFALTAGWLVWFWRRPLQPRLSIILLPVAGATLWALLQLVLNHTVYRYETWSALLYWEANAAILFIGLQAFSAIQVRDLFLKTIVLFGFLISVISPLQMFTSGGKVFWLFQTRYTHYVLGPFVYHNQYAAFIELLLPIALFYSLADRRKAPFYALVSAVMYTSVIASASRAGFILATAELIAVPLLLVWHKTFPVRRFAAVAGYFGGMLLILAAAAGPRLWDRFQLSDPYSVRREFVSSSVQMIRERPILGFGLGNWPTAYPGYASFDNGLFANQAHNDWAQWATEGGVPFAGLLLWVAVWSAVRGVATVWGLGVVTVFLHCLVDYPTQRIALAAVMFALLSAMARERRRDVDQLRAMPRQDGSRRQLAGNFLSLYN